MTRWLSARTWRQRSMSVMSATGCTSHAQARPTTVMSGQDSWHNVKIGRKEHTESQTAVHDESLRCTAHASAAISVSSARPIQPDSTTAANST